MVKTIFVVKRCALLISLLVWWVSAVLAQSGATTGTIIGTVKDGQGGVIIGATVTARQLETNFVRTAEVGEDGIYQFPQLAPGQYQVEVTAEGFISGQEKITLDIGRTEVAKFTLAVVGATDIVEVRASALEIGQTESSSNNNQDRIDSLPINRRDFLDFALTAARVTLDRIPSQGTAATSGLSFNGQTARANNITIDGLDNNDTISNSVRATFSQDAVQEFQTVSDSFSAEFGRALGGVVNIVTKGGSNQLHGSLFFLNRNDSISARDVFAPVKPPYQQDQVGVTLGGPIKRDRAFFFASFERRSIKQNNIVTISDDTVRAARTQGFLLSNGAIPFSIGNSTALARADLQLSANDTSHFRFNYGGIYNGALEPFGGLVDQTNGGQQRLRDKAFTITNTFINPGLNLVNETRFLYSRRNQDLQPIDPGVAVRVLAPEGFILFGRGPFLPEFRQERIYQFVDNVTLTRGHHLIKFGGDLLVVNLPDRSTKIPIIPAGFYFFGQLDFTALSGIPGLPLFSGIQAFDPRQRTPEQRAFLIQLASLLPDIAPGYPKNLDITNLPLPTAYQQGFGNESLSVNQRLFSTFIQDDIKLRPNLMIKAGVRYDINRVRFIPKNSGNFAPRLAISYRPANAPKFSLHASYGLFFAGAQAIGTAFPAQNSTGSGSLRILRVPLPFSILIFQLPGHHFPESDQLPLNVNLTTQLSQFFQYQKNLRNSYTQQISVGVDHQFNQVNTVSVNYVYVRGIKIFATRNINPVVNISSINPVINALNGRVDPSRGDLFEFESAFDSYYNALTVSYERRFSHRFDLQASYTFSKAIDDFIDIRSDLQEVNDPLRPSQERGLSLQDVRSRFLLSGNFEPKFNNRWLRDLQFSTIITLESGRPYNLLAGVDLNMNGDNATGDRPNLVGRNVGITPGFANFDLRVTRTITFRDRYRIQAFVEAFNLFNRVNISTLDRVFPPDGTGQSALPPKQGSRFSAPPSRYRDAFPPRQFQFGFRFNF